MQKQTNNVRDPKGKMLGVPNTSFHFPNQWYDDKYA